MKAQIWIETAVYTLIGLALIGMVLAFALPKIQSSQEKVIIDQTIGSLEAFDGVVNEVLTSGPGNTRTYELQFKKGKILIDGANDLIKFELDEMKSAYSQVNRTIKTGAIQIVTLKAQKGYSTLLILNYSRTANLVINGEENEKLYSPAPTAYKFVVENNGVLVGDRFTVDIKDI